MIVPVSSLTAGQGYRDTPSNTMTVPVCNVSVLDEEHLFRLLARIHCMGVKKLGRTCR